MERDKEIFNSLKGSSNKNLSSIIDNGRCITKPQKIPKAFNKYFDRIAVNNYSCIWYSMIGHHGFLATLNTHSFFKIIVSNINISLYYEIYDCGF